MAPKIYRNYANWPHDPFHPGSEPGQSKLPTHSKFGWSPHLHLPSNNKPSTVPTTTPHISSDFTGNQMCVVTRSFADTWPLRTGDDTYVPYYAPLINGTMDYVTTASEAYNEDDNEMVYFYELSSGRKVKRENVQLIPSQNLAKNNISVVSRFNESDTGI